MILKGMDSLGLVMRSGIKNILQNFYNICQFRSLEKSRNMNRHGVPRIAKMFIEIRKRLSEVNVSIGAIETYRLTLAYSANTLKTVFRVLLFNKSL